MERRLAAILAADVVGYSRLMGVNEEATLQRLNACRSIIDRLINEHQGRVFGSAGDSVIAEFASPVSAVRCAVAVQRSLQEQNADLVEDRRMHYRIGVNLGDVMVEDDNLLGDGVNIAARLESLADPGEVCISANVFEQVENKLDLGYAYLGEKALKNIARPLRVYRVLMTPEETQLTPRDDESRIRWLLSPVPIVIVLLVATAIGYLILQNRGELFDDTASLDQVAVPSPEKPSIAVLPFRNMSGDAEQEYFADGMTDDLITDLSKISGLFVIARNSSFAYKGQYPDVRQVAKDLGVKYILEGSVRRAADTVRINAQLIDAVSGGHVWAERFDRKLTDVFSLQDEVSRKIVAALAVNLTKDEQQQLSQAVQVNPEAYDLLLRGLEQFRRFTRETNSLARDMFKRATRHDPDFARAYADVALTHGIDVLFGWSTPSDELFAQAFEYAEKALQLDPTLRQVHFALSNLYLTTKQHDKAIDAARKAVTLHPNYADGFAQLGQALVYAGRPQDGLDALSKAMALNPRYAFFYTWIEGHAYMLMRRNNAAITAFETVIEKNAHFPGAHLTLASLYGNMGKNQDAEWQAAQILGLRPEFSLREEKRRVPYKTSADLEYYISGLRKAGLPE